MERPPQLTAAECGCHNHEDVLIVSAYIPLSLEPQIFQYQLPSHLRTKAAVDTPVGAELSFSIWWCLLRPAAQACTNRTQTPLHQENKKVFTWEFSSGLQFRTFWALFSIFHKSKPWLPSNVGKPGCICGCFCQAARGRRWAPSWTLQSPPFKWKGSGTNRETQGALESSSRAAVAAWPGDSKVFKGLTPCPLGHSSGPGWSECLGLQLCRWETRTGSGHRQALGPLRAPEGQSGGRAHVHPMSCLWAGQLWTRPNNVSWNPSD